jgi:hypothetical protein
MWVFDPITGHVRSQWNRGFALSVEQGKTKPWGRLVVRPAVHDPNQKWKYNPDKKAPHNWNPFSNDKLAIDVAWGKNNDGAIVHMWTHHGGINQRWDADYNVKRPVYKSSGMTPNKPFMIQSKMTDGRVLFFGRHIAGNQYEMQIRKPQYDEREIYFFDSKSGLIRNARHRNWVIGVQKGRTNKGSRLVLREAEKHSNQAMAHRYLANRPHNWSPLSNLNLCWDVAGGRNADGAYIMMWNCHNGLNQRFEVNYSVNKPVYKSTGIAPGKPFMIKSNLAGGKVLYYANGIGRDLYQMKIRAPKYDYTEIYYFDKNSGHIRNLRYKEWVIAVQPGTIRNGVKLVLTKAKWDPSQKWKHAHNENRFSPFSDHKFCMDIPGGRNADGTIVQMYSCHRGNNQKFTVSYSVTKPIYKSTNIRPNKPFMIQSKMHAGRVLYWANHLGGGQYLMRIRKPQYTKHEIYYFDPVSGHIRNLAEKNWVIAVQKGNNNRGA